MISLILKDPTRGIKRIMQAPIAHIGLQIINTHGGVSRTRNQNKYPGLPDLITNLQAFLSVSVCVCVCVRERERERERKREADQNVYKTEEN